MPDHRADLSDPDVFWLHDHVDKLRLQTLIMKHKEINTMGFSAIEPRLAIASVGIAVAVFLPAWGSIHHTGQGYELGLAVSGFFAMLGTLFGTLTVYDGKWDYRALFFYFPWVLFGIASCFVLVFGAVKSDSHWWQVGLGTVSLLQVVAIFLPAVVWYIQRKPAVSKEKARAPEE